MNWRDRFNQLSGKTRLVVCRLFIHLAGNNVAPLLGVLNRAAHEAVDSEGDLGTMGEGLVQIAQNLLQLDTYWQSAAYERDVFWDEADADDYVTELFTDSAQRYSSDIEADEMNSDEAFSVPVTQNLIVMLTLAYEGEVPALETDLTSISALHAALKAIINLHYNGQLRAIQVHFSPAQLGDELTSDQLLIHYPELIPV